MGFSKNTQATRSTLMSVDSTLSEAITASQDYIPIASTTNFSTSVVAEIETTNEVVSFTDISVNDMKQSEAISTSPWVNTDVTVATDALEAPDGETTADTIIGTGSNMVVKQTVAGGMTASTDITYSFYVKQVVAGFSRVLVYDGTDMFGGWWNTSTAAWTSTNVLASGSVVGYSTTDVGNGWYRIRITGQLTGTAVQAWHYLTDSDGSTTRSTTAKIGLWGTQIEEASATTTYLPTTSAQLVGLTGVTRGANGTTAQSASSSDSIQQLPYALSEINMPTRLKAISVTSDGTGAGRLTLCDKVGTTLLDIDLPDDSGYELDFGDDRGIVFPNGIYVANSDNLTAYTLFTDKHSGTGLS